MCARAHINWEFIFIIFAFFPRRKSVLHIYFEIEASILVIIYKKHVRLVACCCRMEIRCRSDFDRFLMISLFSNSEWTNFLHRRKMAKSLEWNRKKKKIKKINGNIPNASQYHWRKVRFAVIQIEHASAATSKKSQFIRLSEINRSSSFSQNPFNWRMGQVNMRAFSIPSAVVVSVVAGQNPVIVSHKHKDFNRV